MSCSCSKATLMLNILMPAVGMNSKLQLIGNRVMNQSCRHSTAFGP